MRHCVLFVKTLLAVPSAVLFALGISFAPTAWGLTAPPLGDAYVNNSSQPNKTKNFGTVTTLAVGGGSSSLIQFNLATLPPGTIAGDVDQATVILFVNKVTTAGSVSVYLVTSPWTESGVTYNTAPGLGGIVATAPIAATAVDDYVVFDVTAQVKAWVTNPSSNFGIMLAPAATASSTNVLFDSKEGGGGTPTLDITLAIVGPQGAKGDTGATGRTRLRNPSPTWRWGRRPAMSAGIP